MEEQNRNEKKKRRTKPPKPEAERRRHIVQIRVNDAEMEAIERMAQQRGMTVSKLLRNLVLFPRRPVVSAEHVKALIEELAAIRATLGRGGSAVRQAVDKIGKEAADARLTAYVAVVQQVGDLLRGLRK